MAAISSKADLTKCYISNNPLWIMETSPTAWQVSLPKLVGSSRGSKDRDQVLLVPAPPVILGMLNTHLLDGWMDGFCRQLMIYKLFLHPSSYLIFPKALKHKGKLISVSAFNTRLYTGPSQAAVAFFLRRIQMDSHPSWSRTQLNPTHGCCPATQVCLKAKTDTVLYYLSYLTKYIKFWKSLW